MGSIQVANLGKAYKQYPTRSARLAEWLIPFSPPRHAQKWVLQGLNFEVKPGEAIGIIGMNGAGKSTLLKMITGTTEPTTGSVNVTGRIAALLELGMQYHAANNPAKVAEAIRKLREFDPKAMKQLMQATQTTMEAKN
jgi:lipopolysaccharide transport system ATP-binding protein